jgi:hypothetical protein
MICLCERQNQKLNLQRRSWNSEFVNRFRTEMTTMVWTFKENGQNKDTKMALKLKFKGKTPMGQSRMRWFSQVLEESQLLARN